jgi:hypothetical protein
MYKIIDTQFPRYFADGATFKNRKEVREQLISYHSIDVDPKWLCSMNLDTLMSEFQWELEKC